MYTNAEVANKHYANTDDPGGSGLPRRRATVTMLFEN